MTDQNIELSRDGIKLSYLRFLSDSATGQIIILTGIAAYYYPVFGNPLKQALGSEISTEVRILILVILFLLSTPLGLAVNALSWFFLSSFQKKLQAFWFNGGVIFNTQLFKNAQVEFQNQRAKVYFKLQKDNWYTRSQFVKQSLHTFLPYIPNSLDHIRGVRTLFRNISFLSIVFFVLVVITRLCHGLLDLRSFSILVIVNFFLFFGPIVISSLLAFHYTSQIFFRCYILSVAVVDGGEFKDFEKDIVSMLRKAAAYK